MKYTKTDYRGNAQEVHVPVLKWVVMAVVALVLIVGLSVGGAAGCQGYNRYQARANAKNRVRVTAINIRNAQQQARVVHAQNAAVQAQAEQRVIQAIGIRKAQDHIAATLTPLYVQWEAIQAQLKMANSPNHTVIWAPGGANGVPLVSTLNLQQLADSAPSLRKP